MTTEAWAALLTLLLSPIPIMAAVDAFHEIADG